MRRYPFSLLTLFVIVLLSLLPIPDIKMVQDVPLFDKWTHMVMYAGQTVVIWIEYLRCHERLCIRQLVLFGFLGPFAVGGILELTQAYLTTCRSGEWLDFVADGIGAGLGAVAGLMLHGIRRRAKSRRG